MKNILRIVAFLLALVMLSSVFVACNTTTDEPDDEEGTTASVEDGETEGGSNAGDANKPEDSEGESGGDGTEGGSNAGDTNKPEDSEGEPGGDGTEGENNAGDTEPPENTPGPESSLSGNWDGAEYRILGHYDDNKGFYDFEVDYEEIPEDVVGRAVWDRNVAIKDKYGLDVVGTITDNDVHTEAALFIGSGDDQYDLIICQNQTLLTSAQAGNFVNINKLPNVDFDMDCWNASVNDQFTYGDKMFYTSNKFLLQEKHRTWMIWYNRDLASELNVGYLEDEVFNNTWTIDRVIEIARATSANTDGTEGMTSTDRWGFVTSDPYSFGQLAYGCGFRLSTKGADGYPKLVGATDEIDKILDKIFVLSANRSISFFSEYRPTADEDIPEKGEIIFRDGNAVLMAHCISYLDNVSQLDFKYGVLPNPKFDSTQSTYYSVPNWKHGHLFAVPVTISDLEKAGFGLQAISEESVNTSYNAYIEDRCKKQDSEDLDMAKCLGIIFDGVVWDVAFIDDFGGLGAVMRGELLMKGTNTFSTLYNSKKRKATTMIGKIKTEYEKLEDVDD